jgi:hypothetical protein
MRTESSTVTISKVLAAVGKLGPGFYDPPRENSVRLYGEIMSKRKRRKKPKQSTELKLLIQQQQRDMAHSNRIEQHRDNLKNRILKGLPR